MKLGTKIKLPDGRIGTVVYKHLDGYGIVWGEWEVPAQLDPHEHFSPLIPRPEAMLRKVELAHLFDCPCVGEEYEIIYGEVQ